MRYYTLYKLESHGLKTRVGHNNDDIYKVLLSSSNIQLDFEEAENGSKSMQLCYLP